MAASTRHIEPLLPDPSVNSQPHLFVGGGLLRLRRDLPATIVWSPFAGSELVTLGIATETDSGLALSSAEGELLGLATETDTGLVLSATKTLTLGVGTETDSGLPMGEATVPPVPVVATPGGGSTPSRETQDYWERERQRLATDRWLEDDDEVLLLL
jgi:hypothetical protein